MSGLAWLGRALFGSGGGDAEDTGHAAQHGAPPAAAYGGALNAAAASGAGRATTPRPRLTAPGAPLPLSTTPWAARLAQTPPAGARPAADAPARRALLTGSVAAGAEREAPDLQALPNPLSSPRASPRLAERGGKLKDADKGQAAAAAPRDPSGVPRTVQQMRKKCGEPAVSSDFPTGPWETDDDALREIDKFTKNTKTDCGGFAVTWGSSRAGVAGNGAWDRGRQKKLVCHEHGPPHNCKWNLWVEHCVEGWAIKSFSAHDGAAGVAHNHALAQSQEEANARPAMRSIPEELLPTAKSMVKANMSVAAVYRWLRQQIAADGDEVAFIYQDVYHATGASTKERMLDATNLLETLRLREQEEGLFFRSQTDSEGCLTSVFFAMRGAHEIYAIDFDHQVVELDTKHGTNNAGMKLALWVTVDNTYATKILAVSLLLDETEQSFQFTCECFKDCFRVAPAVIFTDSDPAMKVAIDIVFPDSKHFLCIFHLSKNLLSNVRPACGENDALWQRIQSAWWAVVKQTDMASKASFDAEWEALVALVGASTVRGARMDAARKWLAKMADNREQWAYRWTWAYLTMGIDSTQRIEAVHSSVEGSIRANTLLTALMTALEDLNANVASSAATRTFRHVRLNQTAAKCHAHPFIDAAVEILSPAALVLFKAQLQQASFYTVAETAEGSGTFTVTRALAAVAAAEPDAAAAAADVDVGLASARSTAARTTTAEACSCQFPTHYGLPCRHQLQIFIVRQQQVPRGLFHIRWQLLDSKRVRELTEELLCCRPQRASGAAGEPALTRDDRYALMMSLCRDVAALAASSPELYERGYAEVAAVVHRLRGPARDAPAPRRGRRGAAAAEQAGAGGARGGADASARGGAAAADDGAGSAEQCRACWQVGHRKSNRMCPRYGQAPLPKPGGERAAARRVGARRSRGALASSDDADSSEDDESDDSGENENLCHKCGKEGDLVRCDECRHVWHEACLPADAMPLESDPWRCPVCNGSTEHVGYIGNPRQPAVRGSKQRARKRPRTEGTRAQVAAAKAARRSKKVIR